MRHTRYIAFLHRTQAQAARMMERVSWMVARARKMHEEAILAIPYEERNATSI
jgi:hypothetical protein